MGANYAEAGRNRVKPKMIDLPAFYVMGATGNFTPETMKDIPKFWDAFVPHMDNLPRKNNRSFGMMIYHADMEDEEPFCTYLVAVEVDAAAKLQEGFTRYSVPAARYAVFTFNEHISKIGEFIEKAYESWLPEAGLEHAHAPDFELYDERWDPATGTGDVDYYVPVELL